MTALRKEIFKQNPIYRNLPFANEFDVAKRGHYILSGEDKKNRVTRLLSFNNHMDLLLFLLVLGVSSIRITEKNNTIQHQNKRRNSCKGNSITG